MSPRRAFGLRGQGQAEGENGASVSRYDEDEDNWEDDVESEGNPRTQTDLLQQLRKQIRDQSRQIKELSSENSGLKGSVRERTVADVLTAKGVNPKVAKLIPADIDPNPEAVEQWINDYADVFGFQTGGTETAEEAVPDPTADAYERMRQIDGGTPSQGADALQQKLAATQSRDELMQVIRAHGGSG